MYKNLIALLLLLPFLAFCQAETNVQVTGQLHYQNVGIPYGTIVFNNKENGLNTDQTGHFVFAWNGKPDTLFVQCIGFEDEKIVLNQASIAQTIQIEMKPSSANFVANKIDYVEAKPRGKSGTRNAVFRQISAVFGNTFQYGLVFDEADLTERQIKKIQFFILDYPHFDAPFGIRIYDLKNGMPNNDLLDNQIVGNASKPGWSEFDLRKYKIIIPKTGCFVAIQWLVNDPKYRITEDKNPDSYGPTIGLSYQLENNKGLRKYNMDAWLSAKRKSPRNKSLEEDFYYGSPMIKIDCE